MNFDGDRKTFLIFVIALFLVSVISILYYTRQILDLSKGALEAKESIDNLQTKQVTIPPLPNYKDPLLILVVDVSASLKRTDRNCYQYKASVVLANIYSSIASEIMEEGHGPKVAIIPFSAVAAPISFNGKLWCNAGEVKGIEAVLGNLLPQNNTMEDSRIGFWTDHYAAAKCANKVLRAYRDTYPETMGACIVFMTDGAFDPLPLTDAMLSDDQRLKNWNQFTDMLVITDSNKKKELDKVLVDYFQRNLLSKELKDFSPEYLFAFRELWLSNIRRMIRSQKPWADYFVEMERSDVSYVCLSNEIDISEGDYLGTTILDVDNDICTLFCDKDNVQRTDDAQELGYFFTKALAEWLSLEERSIDRESRSFNIEMKTQSLALIAATNTGLPSGNIAVRGKSYSFTDGYCLLNSPIPGKYTISLNDQDADVADVHVFANSRFHWFFEGVPESYSFATKQPEIKVSLYDRAVKAKVRIADHFDATSGFQNRIKCSASLNDGSELFIEMIIDSEGRSYKGKLPQAIEVPKGELKITAVLDGFCYKTGAGTMKAEVKEICITTRVNGSFSIQMISSGEKQKPIGGVKKYSVLKGMGVD